MELKDLDRLVEKYARQGYQKIRVKAGDLEIEVTQANADSTASTTAQPAVADTADTVVKSPMVGVVHLAADLVVGQAVTKGQTLCQLESMKLFNPVLAPANGVLAAILVTDGAAVAYDQPLVKLRKDR